MVFWMHGRFLPSPAASLWVSAQADHGPADPCEAATHHQVDYIMLAQIDERDAHEAEVDDRRPEEESASSPRRKRDKSVRREVDRGHRGDRIGLQAKLARAGCRVRGG